MSLGGSAHTALKSPRRGLDWLQETTSAGAQLTQKKKEELLNASMEKVQAELRRRPLHVRESSVQFSLVQAGPVGSGPRPVLINLSLGGFKQHMLSWDDTHSLRQSVSQSVFEMI